MIYTIYKIINKITGKAYIGQTMNLKRRLKEHRFQNHCRYLNNAIKKYGWNNFKVEILKECGEKEVYDLEQKYIILENTLSPNGYNLVVEKDKKIILTTKSLESRSLKNQQWRHKTNEFIGIYIRKGRYYARMSRFGQRFNHGFNSKIEAAEGYDKMAIYLFGPTARINFVDNLNQYLKMDLKKFFEWFSAKRKTISKYKYITFDKNSKKWISYITVSKNNRQTIGAFDTEEEAYQNLLKFKQSDMSPKNYRKNVLLLSK